MSAVTAPSAPGTPNREILTRAIPGAPMLLVFLVILGGSITALTTPLEDWQRFIAIALLPITFICLTGLFTLQPNEARVLILFGRYKGTVRHTGFY